MKHSVANLAAFHRLIAIVELCALTGFIAALMLGARFTSPAELLAGDELTMKIVWMLRAPRAVAALLIGCSLAVSGLMLQSYFRNPLADPYILGVSSGAALMAAVKIVFLPNIPIPLPLFAIAGGGAIVAGAWLVSRAARGDITITLLLSGVALSILCGSILSVLILWARPGEMGLIVRWLMGTLSGIGWVEVAWLAAACAVGIAVAARYAREMNAVQLGAVVAGSVGVDMRVAQAVLVGAATILAASTVAAAGIVGFVGLIVPHTCRMIVGGDARVLLPCVALTGAAVMIWCDTLARTATTSGELPIGAVTAIIGIPFFLWLMRRGRIFA
jgi:iron complex transport system permease protein